MKRYVFMDKKEYEKLTEFIGIDMISNLIEADFSLEFIRDCFLKVDKIFKICRIRILIG